MFVATFIATVFLAYAVDASPCCVLETGASPSVIKPVGYTTETTCGCNPPCFNAKQALYQKFPLLYTLNSRKCKFFCNKISGVNACPPEPTPVTVALPAPCPTAQAAPAPVPVQVVNECPACAAAAANPVPPEVLSFLYGSAAPAAHTCPCSAQ